MSDELKTCPFCGDAAFVYSQEPSHWSGARYQPDVFKVGCINCDCVFDTEYEQEDKAIEAWNTRAKPPHIEGLDTIKKHLQGASNTGAHTVLTLYETRQALKIVKSYAAMMEDE